MREVSELGILERVIAARSTSVALHPHSSSSDLHTRASSTPSIHKSSRAPYGTGPKRKFASWWRKHLKDYEPLIELRRLRPSSPLTWSEAPFILKLEFYHWAMSLMGSVYTFTLNLRPDIRISREKAAETMRLGLPKDRPATRAGAWS